jgi:hypothetical protein
MLKKSIINSFKLAEINDATSSETDSNLSEYSITPKGHYYPRTEIDSIDNSDSDYGLFDIECPSSTSALASSSECDITASFSSDEFTQLTHKLFNTMPDMSNARVLFTYSNEKSSVICRSFSSRSFEYQAINVSIQGFRIVQYPCGNRADFKLVAEINGIRIVLWKRYSDFEHFAKSLAESSEALLDAKLSWENLLAFKNVFRNLSIEYLLKKMLRLEHFLRSALFELKCPLSFLEFLGN